MKPITKTMSLLLSTAVFIGVLSGCPTDTPPEGSKAEPEFSGVPYIINVAPDDPRYDPDSFIPPSNWPTAGDTLYVDTADLEANNPLYGEFYYFWFRAGRDEELIPIPGAYQASYTTVSGDKTYSIYVSVHGSGYTGGVLSDPVGPVR